MQRLILPINKMRVTAGYRNKEYEKLFGFKHYGVDCTSTDGSTIFYASGRGEVLCHGFDPVCGNVLIVRYDSCIMRKEVEDEELVVKDLVIRYFHLAKFKVKVGDKVTKDTILGHYGSTGYSTGPHLHIELDEDVEYYAYSPTISKNSRVILKGIDTTLNPTKVLFVKPTYPDNQHIINSFYDTVSSADLDYEVLKNGVVR